MASFIEIDGTIIKGTFVDRPNRFLARVKLPNGVSPCFLPNPGRMHELLFPGVEVFVREALKENRKTRYDMIGVMHHRELVSVDTRIPNKLVFKALKNRDLEEFKDYDVVKPESSYRKSRFDFFLANKTEKCFLEVKSCTLVKDGVALFPDAPTLRGARHLRELIEAKKEGYRAYVLFFIQRVNAHVFAPNDKTDPEFGEALREALKNGVEAFAYYSEFLGNRIVLRDKIAIKPRV